MLDLTASALKRDMPSFGGACTNKGRIGRASENKGTTSKKWTIDMNRKHIVARGAFIDEPS